MKGLIIVSEQILDDYVGKEILIDDMRKIFVDKWIIAELTGENDKFRSVGKAIIYFDTEKETHLELRKMRENGDRRRTLLFRGSYGPNTIKPRFGRVTNEDY